MNLLAACLHSKHDLGRGSIVLKALGLGSPTSQLQQREVVGPCSSPWPAALVAVPLSPNLQRFLCVNAGKAQSVGAI